MVASRVGLKRSLRKSELKNLNCWKRAIVLKTPVTGSLSVIGMLVPTDREKDYESMKRHDFSPLRAGVLCAARSHGEDVLVR
jgi:hypothetical protein